jgi:hypothetical protein
MRLMLRQRSNIAAMPTLVPIAPIHGEYRKRGDKVD